MWTIRELDQKWSNGDTTRCSYGILFIACGSFNSLSHNSGPVVFFIRLLICFHFFPLEYSKRDDTCVSTGISSVAFFLQNIHRFIFFQFLFEVSVDGSAELSCPLY